MFTSLSGYQGRRYMYHWSGIWKALGAEKSKKKREEKAGKV